MTGDTYHHGNLRAAILSAAADIIETEGIDRLTLREVARRVDVSHAAPAHHFHDRRGLLTAVAAQGFGLLTTALDAAGEDFLEVAVSYVRFATVEHPGHYTVMFSGAELYARDTELVANRSAAERVLLRGISTVRANGSDGDQAFAPLAAFSLVHGIATLWNAQSLDPRYRELGPERLTRSIAPLLFRSRSS
jgi:AcrR family transcriptional regulator